MYVGGDGDGPNGEVTTGPFAGWTASDREPGPAGSSPDRAGSSATLGSQPRSATRILRRPVFPTAAQVDDAIQNWTVYDTAPWRPASTGSFRNRLEGWLAIGRRGRLAAAQPGTHLGRRRHGPGHVAERPGLLPAPLQRRPALGTLAARPPGRVLPAGERRARRATTSTTRCSTLTPPSATPARSLDYRRTLGFIYDTDPPLVDLPVPTVNFHDVPTLETTWRAAVFHVRAGSPVHLEVVPGSGSGRAVLAHAAGRSGDPRAAGRQRSPTTWSASGSPSPARRRRAPAPTAPCRSAAWRPARSSTSTLTANTVAAADDRRRLRPRQVGQHEPARRAPARPACRCCTRRPHGASS